MKFVIDMNNVVESLLDDRRFEVYEKRPDGHFIKYIVHIDETDCMVRMWDMTDNSDEDVSISFSEYLEMVSAFKEKFHSDGSIHYVKNEF